MSWIRSSKGIALVVLFAVSLAAVGVAAGLTVSDEGVPEESRVGQQVNATVTIEDPFLDTQNEWTLIAATELRNVSWTVTMLQQGEQVNQNSYGRQRFEQTLNADNGGDTLRIEIVGDTPPVRNFTYDPAETYTFYDLDQRIGNNTQDLNESAVHHYTNKSKEARTAIDEAAQTINETDAGSDATDLLNNSISSYNNGGFNNAIDLANQAKNEAESAQQSAQQTQMLIYGAAALVVLLLVGGGIYYWRSQQDDYGKLQ